MGLYGFLSSNSGYFRDITWRGRSATVAMRRVRTTALSRSVTQVGQVQAEVILGAPGTRGEQGFVAFVAQGDRDGLLTGVVESDVEPARVFTGRVDGYVEDFLWRFRGNFQLGKAHEGVRKQGQQLA
jgi:hypothetical protein